MLERIYDTIISIVGCIFGGMVYYFIMLIVKPGFHSTGKLFNNNTELSMLMLSIVVSALIFNTIAPAVKSTGRKTVVNIGKDLEGVPTSRIVAGVVGVIAGLVLALLISMTYRSIISSGWYAIITMLLYILCGYVGFAVATSKIKEAHGVIPLHLSTIAGSLFGRQKNSTGVPKIIDTSVLIDGRISEVIRSGFVEGPFVIPEFVLVELRHISDSSDALKRERGRRGLDILEDMQKEFRIDIINTDTMKALEDIPEVDVKLVKLAKSLSGRLITTDYNLNKVAKINDVAVMNVNELANAIKPAVIPGEKMAINVIKQGKDPSQGIGYLEDGTMVVVEDGRPFIGEAIVINVTSVIQTSAGKMIFGRNKLRNN